MRCSGELGTTSAILREFLPLSGRDQDIFRYSVQDLQQRFGDVYVANAEFILGKLQEFAALQGHCLAKVLRVYTRHVAQVVEERQFYQQTGLYRSAPGSSAPMGSTEGLQPDLAYLYVLTLSTVLNHSRYEVFRHFRQTVPAWLEPSGPLLEIGGGNCLDALFLSNFGPLDSYEINPLSLVWHQLLGLEGRVDLRTELYDFGHSGKYAFVSMIELLEHIQDPGEYLAGAHRVLRDDGCAYLTFAVRMPQFDHFYEFVSVEQCRSLISDHGFHIVEEHCAIDTLNPYEEADRWRLADNVRQAVIYCCLVEKQKREHSAVSGFLEDLESE